MWQEVVRLVDGHRLDSAELYGVVDCVRNPLLSIEGNVTV